MKVLFASRTPLDSQNAGNVRYIVSLLQLLSENNFSVDYFSLRTLSSYSKSFISDLIGHHSQVFDYDYEWKRPQPLLKELGIYKVDNEVSLLLLNTFKSIVQENNYDLVIVDYIYLSIFSEVTPSKTRFIVNTHDIHANRHLLVNPNQLDASFSTYSVSPADEKLALSRADAFISITTKERDYFSSLNPDAEPILYPFSPAEMSVGSFIDSDQTTLIDPAKIAVGFIGSSNMVNLSGILEFLQGMNNNNLKSIQIHIKLAGSICDEIDIELYKNLSLN